MLQASDQNHLWVIFQQLLALSIIYISRCPLTARTFMCSILPPSRSYSTASLTPHPAHMPRTLASTPSYPSYPNHGSCPSRYNPYDPVFPTDEATALSAVRNLKDVAVNGRNLRVESSTDEPGPRRGRGGAELPSTGRGRYRDDSPPPPQRAPLPPVRDEPPPAGMVDLNLLPTGQDTPGKATDAISKTLAVINPGQMQDVMAGMKVSCRIRKA